MFQPDSMQLNLGHDKNAESDIRDMFELFWWEHLGRNARVAVAYLHTAVVQAAIEAPWNICNI